MADLEGVILNDYLLVECISKGGVADVYRGRRRGEDGYDVAVKIFRPTYAQRESFREYFLGEAEKIGQFDHSNILPFLEYGEGDNLLYLVLPFVTTGTLEDLLERVGGHLPALQAQPVLQQLCSAIQYAHEHHVTHGNLKPSNIFIANDGRILLSDFGIARGYDDSQQSLTRMGWGSAEYAAPEQSLGLLRSSSDIYSLGVLLFRILTGRVPFSGHTPVEVLLKHVRQQPPAAREIVPSISEAVESVLRTALQKRSEDRYTSAEEFCNAFSAAVTVAPVASPISQSVGVMQPFFAASTGLTQPHTPLPAVNPQALTIDPQTPMPAFIALAPAALTETSPAPSPSNEEWLLGKRTEGAGDSDTTEVRPKSFLSGETKSVSQPWLTEPPEWSPLAVASSTEAPGAVPLTAGAYLQSSPDITRSAPEPIPIPPAVPVAEQKSGGTNRLWLTILVVAFLLLGLLGALLSSFFFPS